MGNDTVKKSQKNIQEFEEIIPHKKFEKYKLVNDNYLQISTQVDQQELNTWKNNLKKIKNFTDHEVLLLQRKYQEDRHGLCSNNYKLDINFDNYPYIFSDEISNRIQIKKYFEEPELWYLLLCLLIAAKNFAVLKSKIGDVRPYNIFINEEGQIKIANLYSWPYERTNFQKTAYFNEATFLAPEEMALLEKKSLANTTDKIKSQSFSIGLTMLNSLILFDSTQLYNSTFFTFDSKRLNDKLQEMRSFEWTDQNDHNHSYSKLLKGIVYSLCNINAQQRASSLELYNMLQPFQEQIMKLESFDYNSVKFNYPAQFHRIENVKSMNILLEKRQFPNSYSAVQQSVKYQPPQPIQYQQAAQSVKYQPVAQPIQPPSQPIQYQPPSQPIQYQQAVQSIQYQQPSQPLQYQQASQSIQYQQQSQPVQYQALFQSQQSKTQQIQANQTQYNRQTYQNPMPPPIQSQIYQRVAQVAPQDKPKEIVHYANPINQQSTTYQLPRITSVFSQPIRYQPQQQLLSWQKPLDPYIPSKIEGISSNNFNFNTYKQPVKVQIGSIEAFKEVKSSDLASPISSFNFNSYTATAPNGIKANNLPPIQSYQVNTSSNAGMDSGFLRKLEEQLQISRQKFPS